MQFAKALHAHVGIISPMLSRVGFIVADVENDLLPSISGTQCSEQGVLLSAQTSTMLVHLLSVSRSLPHTLHLSHFLNGLQ